MAEQGWAITDLKDFDHLELSWVKGKGYNIYDKRDIECDPLFEFGDNKELAIIKFDILVFDYLKDKYLLE